MARKISAFGPSVKKVTYGAVAQSFYNIGYVINIDGLFLCLSCYWIKFCEINKVTVTSLDSFIGSIGLG